MPDAIIRSLIAISRSGHSGWYGPISCSRNDGWVMNAVGMDARKLWERVELWPHPAAESRLPLSATRLPMPSGRFAFPLDGVYLAPAGHDEARRTGYSRLDEFLLVLTISHHGTCAPMTVRSASQAGTPTAARLALVLAQLGRIVVGKDEPLRLALACLLARGHLLIEDIPGVGKSTLAQALAATLGLKYARVQFTSDLLPADVLGVSIYDERTQSFRFHAGPIFNSVVLADEINRAPPKTQSALLEAMEERQVSQDGQTRRAARPVLRHRHAESRSSRSARTRCRNRSSTAS